MSIDQDVDVEFGGKKYKFRLTNLAYARFEDKVGKTFHEWAANMTNKTVTTGEMLMLLWVGLQFHHKNEDITYEKLGEELIQPHELMGAPMFELIMKAIAISFGKGDEVKTLEEAAKAAEAVAEEVSEESGEIQAVTG